MRGRETCSSFTSPRTDSHINEKRSPEIQGAVTLTCPSSDKPSWLLSPDASHPAPPPRFPLSWAAALSPAESDSPVTAAGENTPSACRTGLASPAVTAVCWVPEETRPRGPPRCRLPGPLPPSGSQQTTSPTAQSTDGQVGSPKPLHSLPPPEGLHPQAGRSAHTRLRPPPRPASPAAPGPRSTQQPPSLGLRP